MKNKAYLINNIDDYGKLIAYCIYKDISVWRTYYDDRDKGKFCCNIDWKDKRCYYGTLNFYQREGYEIVVPKFEIDEFGKVQLLN